MSIFSLVTGRPGPSGFGSASTSEQVSQGIDASNLTAIVTGELFLLDTTIVMIISVVCLLGTFFFLVFWCCVLCISL